MSSFSNTLLFIVAAGLLTIGLLGLELQKYQLKFEAVHVKSRAFTRSSFETDDAESKKGNDVSPTISCAADPMQETEQRLKHRRQTLLDECQKKSLLRDIPSDVAYVKNPFLKTSLFYSDRYKILFCQIPKCATRSQAKFLAAIEGLIEPGEFETVSEPRATSLIQKHRSARRIPNMERMKRIMEEYSKVVIVREPFSRLLSAFRNKLENNKRGDSYANLARKLHSKYSNGTGEEINGAPVVTLEDFIAHLTDPKSGAQGDQHWNFFNRLCAPCDLKYDYIVHMDTIQGDMHYLLSKFGIKNFTFPLSFDSFTDNQKVEDCFKKASPSLVNALYHTYKLDYELFGMSTPRQF